MSREKRERLKKGNIFAPLIFSFGALLEDLPLDDFRRDPTKVSNSLRTIQNYFGADGVFCYGDDNLLPTAMGDICGCSLASGGGPALDPGRAGEFEGRVEELLRCESPSVAIEVTKRLNMLLPQTLLSGLITGPATLASRLTGLATEEVLANPRLSSLAAKAALTYLKALGDTGIDILVVSEEALPPLDADLAKSLNRMYSPLWNTAKYYGFPALLMVRDFRPENVRPLRRIVDSLIFPAEADPELWQKQKKVSFSIPVSVMEKTPEEVTEYLAGSGVEEAMQTSRLFLVTTRGEIPCEVHKESMIQGIQTIRDHLRQV